MVAIDISRFVVTPHSETRNWIIVYEPLEVDLPESAYPYCCYINHVIFYRSQDDRTVLAETDHQIRYSWHGNTILQYGKQQFILMTGKVVYHADRWQCQWIAHKTTGLFEEGGTGFWCQGECVFIAASHGTAAIDKYRQDLANAEIAVTCQFPDAIIRRSTYEKLAKVEEVLSLAEEVLAEISVCSLEHGVLVGKALQQIKAYRSRNEC